MSWRPATREDIAHVSANLRWADILEADAMYGIQPQLWLPEHQSKNTQALVVDAGYTIGLAGVEPWSPDIGQIWMVSTPQLYDHRYEFLRKCKRFIAEAHNTYPVLFNYVDARQTDHLKWLSWCGFRSVSLQKRGAYGLPFHEMIRIR